MATITYTPPHPIIFIFDFGNKNMMVPEYDRALVVSSNQSCISVRTIAEVDGDVTVDLRTGVPDVQQTPPVKVFNGVIDIPENKVSIVTSENERLLEVDVNTIRAEITIFVDDEDTPSEILVFAGPAK